MKNILPIIVYPSPILHKKSRNIDQKDDREFLSVLVENMKTTMLQNNGVGLAAPQIGKNIRLFVADWGEGFKTFINPAIEEFSTKQVSAEEGCLSVPKRFEYIERPASIKIKAKDLEGKEFEVDLSGLAARVAQHELDHLNGILFIDKL